MKDIDGDKKLFIIWAGGGNPMSKINAMEPQRFGVEIATGGNILAALTAYKGAIDGAWSWLVTTIGGLMGTLDGMSSEAPKG